MEEQQNFNHPFKCRTCQISFADKGLLILHYNTADHQSKVKEKVTQNVKVVSTAVFPVTIIGNSTPINTTSTCIKSVNITNTVTNTALLQNAGDNEKIPYQFSTSDISSSYSQAPVREIHTRSVPYPLKSPTLHELVLSGNPIGLSTPAERVSTTTEETTCNTTKTAVAQTSKQPGIQPFSRVTSTPVSFETFIQPINSLPVPPHLNLNNIFHCFLCDNICASATALHQHQVIRHLGRDLPSPVLHSLFFFGRNAMVPSLSHTQQSERDEPSEKQPRTILRHLETSASVISTKHSPNLRSLAVNNAKNIAEALLPTGELGTIPSSTPASPFSATPFFVQNAATPSFTVPGSKILNTSSPVTGIHMPSQMQHNQFATRRGFDLSLPKPVITNLPSAAVMNKNSPLLWPMLLPLNPSMPSEPHNPMMQREGEHLCFKDLLNNFNNPHPALAGYGKMIEAKAPIRMKNHKRPTSDKKKKENKVSASVYKRNNNLTKINPIYNEIKTFPNIAGLKVEQTAHLKKPGNVSLNSITSANSAIFTKSKALSSTATSCPPTSSSLNSLCLRNSLPESLRCNLHQSASTSSMMLQMFSSPPTSETPHITGTPSYIPLPSPSTSKRTNHTQFTDYQEHALRTFFENNPDPDYSDLEYLSILGLSIKDICKWFKNARYEAREVKNIKLPATREEGNTRPAEKVSAKNNQNEIKCAQCGESFAEFLMWRGHLIEHMVDHSPVSSPVLQGDLLPTPALKEMLQTEQNLVCDEKSQTAHPINERQRFNVRSEELEYVYKQSKREEKDPGIEILKSISGVVELGKNLAHPWLKDTIGKKENCKFGAPEQILHLQCPLCPAFFEERPSLEMHLETQHAYLYTKCDIDTGDIPEREGDSNQEPRKPFMD